jgi:methionine synthase II (cobalamin-independent)
VIAPDCGMKFLAQVAIRQLRSMVEGARIVRAELLRG